jgi:hypothetical protein
MHTGQGDVGRRSRNHGKWFGTGNRRMPDLPGVASFFVRGSHVTLPKGLRMVWKTLQRGGYPQCPVGELGATWSHLVPL